MSNVNTQQVKMAFVDRMYDEIKDVVEPKLLEVAASGAYILGPYVREFEEAMERNYGFGHALGVADGTNSLAMALRACGVEDGDEVIVPAYTIFVDASVVCMLGAIPQFVDVGSDYNLDPEAFEQAITPKTKAVIVVHLFGQTADMDAINRIAQRHGVKVIEDCAQAIGAKYGEKYAGTLGDIGSFSFYPTKNLGCMGDGGLVTSSDEALYDSLSILRAHGIRNTPYIPEVWGYNSRLDAIQAAILRVKLEFLTGWEKRRRAIAARYQSEIDNPKVSLPKEEAGRHHVWHMFTIQTPNRAELIGHLQDRGILNAIFYPKLVQDTPAFSKYQSHQVSKAWPEATRLVGSVLSIPVAPQLNDDEVRQVIDAINSF